MGTATATPPGSVGVRGHNGLKERAAATTSKRYAPPLPSAGAAAGEPLLGCNGIAPAPAAAAAAPSSTTPLGAAAGTRCSSTYSLLKTSARRLTAPTPSALIGLW